MPLTRSTVTRRARYEKNFSAPVNRMPNELIVEVFKQALPKERWARHRFLASISGTSRLWRQIALSTTFLWTTITLFPACRRELRTVNLKFLRALEIVTLYLDRAGQTMPIDLWLDFAVIPHITKDADPAISLLLQNIHRCQSLTLRLHGLYVSRIFPLVGNLHSLRNLEVRVDPPNFSSRTFDLTESSSELHLQSLSISGIELLARPSIQWESLIHLTVFGVDLFACHFETVLCRCTNLISLKCDLIDLELFVSDAGPIEFPHLTLLDIRSSDYLPILPSFLIRAPRLLHLRVQGFSCNFRSVGADCPLLRTIALSPSNHPIVLHEEPLRTCPNLTALELIASWPIVHTPEALAQVPLAPLAETRPMLNPALAHVRLRRSPPGNTQFREDIRAHLQMILRQRSQVSLEFEVAPGLTSGLDALIIEFPGRVHAVDDFAMLPPISDLF